MNPRIIGWLSLSFLIFAALAVLTALIVAPPGQRPGTVEEYLARQEARQGLTWINLFVIFIYSILMVAVFTGLYRLYRQQAPVLALTALLCLPCFFMLTWLFYGSAQVWTAFVVQLHQQAEYREAVSLYIKTLLGDGPSVLTRIIVLPYFFMSIPALIFGWMMRKETLLKRLAGFGLMINGLCYLAGTGGLLSGHSFFNFIGIAGTIAFLLTLLLMSIGFLRRPRPLAETAETVPA